MSEHELNLFLLGLFSVLDAIVDQPMEEAVAQLPLNADVLATLAGKSTALTPVYELVLAFERGEWRQIGSLGEQLAVDDQLVARMYQEAILWAQGVLSSQQAEPMKQAS